MSFLHNLESMQFQSKSLLCICSAWPVNYKNHMKLFPTFFFLFPDIWVQRHGDRSREVWCPTERCWSLMEQGWCTSERPPLHSVGAHIRASLKGGRHGMRNQRLNKVRRHPYWGRRTAQLGFSEPHGGKSSAEEVAWHRVSERGWGAEGIPLGETAEGTNVGCCNPSGSEEDMCIGAETGYKQEVWTNNQRYWWWEPAYCQERVKNGKGNTRMNHVGLDCKYWWQLWLFTVFGHKTTDECLHVCMYTHVHTRYSLLLTEGAYERMLTPVQ